MNAYANMNTKNIQSKTSTSSKNTNEYQTSDTTRSTGNAKPGSMMSKANMVKDFNEKNNK